MPSCNEDPYDAACYCSPRYGSGSRSRVLDLETGRYTCCGVVDYSGIYDRGDGVCRGWSTGTLDPFRTYAEPNYGPSPNLEVGQRMQITMAATFPLARVRRNAYICDRGSVPRYVQYPNLNAGSSFVETVACVPWDSINSQYSVTDGEPWDSGNFAFYLIRGCDGSPADEQYVCRPQSHVGSPCNVGPLDFRSTYYSGPSRPTTSSNGNAPETVQGVTPWFFWLMLVIVIILLVITTALIATRGMPPLTGV